MNNFEKELNDSTYGLRFIVATDMECDIILKYCEDNKIKYKRVSQNIQEFLVTDDGTNCTWDINVIWYYGTIKDQDTITCLSCGKALF